MSVSKRRTSDIEEKLLPLPCSQKQYETISKRFLIPVPYIDTLLHGATVLVEVPRHYYENEDASGTL